MDLSLRSTLTDRDAHILFHAPVGSQIVCGWETYRKNNRGTWSADHSSDRTTYTSRELAERGFGPHDLAAVPSNNYPA